MPKMYDILKCMTIAGIKVLIVGQSFNLPYEVVHLDGTSHLLETIATFRPDVIVTSDFFPGVLNLSPFELRKRWINVPTDAPIDDICNSIESCYEFNIWTEHQFQKDHPLVSVYTPTYNTGDYLQETFQSLKGQTYANWEWVVIDDHSSDKTWARLQDFATQDYRIRPFQSAVNLGKIGATKNLATRLCRGKYLVELDHDDMLTENALEEVKNAFENNPEVGMVYTNSASFYENGNPQRFGGEPWEEPGRYKEIEYHGRKYLECKNPNIYDRFGPLFTQQFAWFLTVGPHHIRAFRAEAFWELGGYNAELGVADDFDLYARFFLRSKCLHIDKMLYLYRYRDANGNTTFQRLQSIQDHLALARNHYGAEFEKINEIRLKENQSINQTPKVKTTSPNQDDGTGISFIVLDATGSIHAVNCIKSLNKYAPDSEIILVENGCTSQARLIADVTVTSIANLGFAAGCNLGAAAASREFLCFINDDAELVNETTYKKLLEATKENIIAGVYSNKAKPPQGNYTRGSMPSESQTLPMVVGLCMLISKENFDTLGGFDTRLLTFEDDDLCLRASKIGIPSVVLGGSFVHHKAHQTFKAMGLDHVEVENINQKIFEKKHQKIKVIAIAKNEESCIVDFFKQFEPITKDWFLLDTGSDDKTIELAKSIGVNVESAPFVDFATTRNQALSTFDPEGSWVIFLDPDERLDKQTIAAIPELVFHAEAENYLAPLVAVYPDGTRREFVAKPFLFMNNKESRWCFKVHEKWLNNNTCLVTNALIEHQIEFHTGKHREGAEDLYSKLMSEEPYFQDPKYKSKMREEYCILDYDHVTDDRIKNIQAGPLVSVIVPTYKRKELLEKAVSSALNQSYKNLEVIVIGDNCPELQLNMFTDPRIRVINLEKNYGAGGAEPRNVGINLAAGSWIAYLDDDNTWATDHVSNLLTTILDKNTVWGWSSMMVNGVDLKFDRLERGSIDTSCVIHHKSLINKYGYWKQRSNEGVFHAEDCNENCSNNCIPKYAHDFELFWRWREEPNTVTKYSSVIYNASTSGQSEFLEQLISRNK